MGVVGTMRGITVLALVASILLAQPRVVASGAVVFASASDQGYFSGDTTASQAPSGFPHTTYETLDRDVIDTIVGGLINTENVGALPNWVDAEALTRQKPRVVLLGTSSAEITPSDLAETNVAEDISRMRAEIVAPNAGVVHGEINSNSITETVFRSFRGRRFVAGECGDELGTETFMRLDATDAIGHLRRVLQETGSSTEHTADLVLLCDESTSSQKSVLSVFADFTQALRTDGVSFAGVFFGTGDGGRDADETEVSSCVQKARLASGELKLVLVSDTQGNSPSRSLLQDDEAPICDDLCQLQTNVISGLVFAWVLVMTILFGYALMHNLDSPTRFEKSKEEDGR